MAYLMESEQIIRNFDTGAELKCYAGDVQVYFESGEIALFLTWIDSLGIRNWMAY